MSDKNVDAERSKGLTNETLRERYEEIYSQGEEKYFSKFDETGKNRSEANSHVLSLVDWKGKSVVDVGCGTGELLQQIAGRGAAALTGIDYSRKAIDIAQSRNSFDNARYIAGDIFEIAPAKADVVVSCGTIEHSNEPPRFLEALSGWCRHDGLLIVTCPHFINVRGFVWMALSLLQDVPMSLTDLHSIHPWQMERWCEQTGLRVRDFRTCDYRRANGEALLKDFDKRLRNALRDAGIDNKNVPRYMDYLSELTSYLENREERVLHGATAVYVLEKNDDR